MSIVWKDEYSVGVPSIDTQHKKILEYISDLDCILNSGDVDRDKLLAIFNNMIKYTKSHFVHEEKLFDAYGYDYNEEHKRKHSNLIESLDKIGQLLERKELYPVEKLRELLVHWFLDHILVEDKKYQEFFKCNGVI